MQAWLLAAAGVVAEFWAWRMIWIVHHGVLSTPDVTVCRIQRSERFFNRYFLLPWPGIKATHTSHAHPRGILQGCFDLWSLAWMFQRRLGENSCVPLLWGDEIVGVIREQLNFANRMYNEVLNALFWAKRTWRTHTVTHRPWVHFIFKKLTHLH